MSGLAGAAHNIRLSDPTPANPAMDPSGVSVVIDGGANDDAPVYSDSGAVLRIEHGDGSITVSLDGRPISDPKRDAPGGWYENLAEKIDSMELSRIANDLIRGIEDDLQSRREWIENLTTGLKIMGLFLEQPQTGAGTDSAPLEGMSRIRHPLMAEAVLRFQANARSELLPTDGPVKIRNDDNDDDTNKDALANALELDLNHYLTYTASEYYPDTDRMLLKLGFAGTTFKKVYFCPLRQRPVSETVEVEDLIVNSEATDLRNARRITHRTTMRPSVVRRMQLIGAYRDIELGTPKPRNLDPLQREARSQVGITSNSNPEDRDREIYECCCELDIKGYEHTYKGKPSLLEVPYRVTIDVSSKEILSIVRNYEEEDQDLPTASMQFVKYTFVPGFGFYDIGLLHILGNATQAVTAAWRELLDAGMFSNFPGFLMAKNGARQNTNIFRVPPGGAAQIDTNGVPIKDAVMPLPYQPPSVALMQLTDNIAETGQRVGGTAELQVGEGKADMPVGTTLALIEQATKLLNSVHKRLHCSQAEEFQLLVACFRAHPKSFWQRKGKSGVKWDEETFQKALENCNFVPQADPNTASHTQRILKVMALKQLASENQSLYDPIAVDTAAIKAIGFNDPKQFFAPPAAQAAPPPQLQEMQAKMATEKTKADAAMVKAKADEAEAQAKVQGLGAFAPKAETPREGGGEQGDTKSDLMTAQAKLTDAETKKQALGLKAAETKIEDENRDQDRDSREKVQVMEMVRDIIMHPEVPPASAASEGEEVGKQIGLAGGEKPKGAGDEG